MQDGTEGVSRQDTGRHEEQDITSKWHKVVGFQGSAILNYHPRLITITLYDTKDIYSNILSDPKCYASCNVVAYQRNRQAPAERFDVYKKKAAKAPTPATKPAALSELAAPVN